MMESKLLECIQYSLDHYLWQNAVFLAERLYAEAVTEAHLHTLATCYYKSGKTNRAYFVLKNSSSRENRYLFAVCCYELGKLKEAELALTSINPDPASLYLLGLIYRKGNQRERAAGCFKDSLKMYPFMWSAFEYLCTIEDADPSSFFIGGAPTTLPTIPKVAVTGTISTPITPATPLNAHPQPSPIPMQLTSPVHEFATPSTNMVTPLAPPLLTTPSPVWQPKGNVDDAAFATPTFVTPTPSTPIRAKPAAPANKRKPEDAKRKQPRINLFADQPPAVRRSARLSFGSVETTNTNTSTTNTTNTANTTNTTNFTTSAQPSNIAPSNVNGNDKAHKRDKDKRRVKGRPTAPLTANVNMNSTGDEFEADNTARLLHKPYHHSQPFNKGDSQQGMNEQLSPTQARTGWALTLAGRAHFELVDYRSASSCFEEARRNEPHRVEGMEIYSTVLWHLRRETDLSHLAHSLVEFDHLDPRSWCAVGNCFSLQKDHDTALKMFKRALQIDPHFTYAHTLSGHELVANDDLDKALASYRAAIRTDPRHYNAWYGLGMIYFRQEKYKLAEIHFRRALSINGGSTVLYCYVGVVLGENKQYAEALQMLDAAISLDSKNTLARYKKAHILASLQETQAALTELESLRDTAPREASIYTLLAKLYRQSKQPYKALSALAAAADLDPKNASNLKAAIERITNPNLSGAADFDEEDDIL